jgi:sulfopyruvate decarboxylase TPP-binding subunit
MTVEPPSRDHASAATLLSALKDQGVTHVVGLPDNTSAVFLALADLDQDITTLPVTREGEAFAIASGLWLGGKDPVVVVQNTGLLESGDSLRGTAVRMGAPLLCFVTYRGYRAMRERAPEPQAGGWEIDTLTRSDLDSVALYTEPTLRAWGIPYRLYASDDPATLVRDAWEEAHRDMRPVALLVTQALT